MLVGVEGAGVHHVFVFGGFYLNPPQEGLAVEVVGDKGIRTFEDDAVLAALGVSLVDHRVAGEAGLHFAKQTDFAVRDRVGYRG